MQQQLLMPRRAICHAHVSGPGRGLLLLGLLLQLLWLPWQPCLHTWSVLVVVEVVLQSAVKGKVLCCGKAQSHSDRCL